MPSWLSNSICPVASTVQRSCHRQTHPVVLWAVVTGEPVVSSPVVTPVLPSGSPTLSLSSASLLCSCYLFLLSCYFLSVLAVDIDSLWRSSIRQIGSGAMKGTVHCFILCFSSGPSSNFLFSLPDLFFLFCLELCAGSHCFPRWTYPLINELWKPSYLLGA